MRSTTSARFALSLLTAGLPEPGPSGPPFSLLFYFPRLSFSLSLRFFFVSFSARIFLLVLVSLSMRAVHIGNLHSAPVFAVPIRMSTILNALIQRFSPKFYF